MDDGGGVVDGGSLLLPHSFLIPHHHVLFSFFLLLLVVPRLAPLAFPPLFFCVRFCCDLPFPILPSAFHTVLFRTQFARKKNIKKITSSFSQAAPTSHSLRSMTFSF